MQLMNSTQQHMLPRLLAANSRMASVWRSGHHMRPQLQGRCIRHPAAPLSTLRQRRCLRAPAAPWAMVQAATAASTHSSAQAEPAAGKNPASTDPASPVDVQHKGPPAEPQPSGKVTVAVIDIGTSSFHLVVVRASVGDQRRLEVVDQVMSCNFDAHLLLASDGSN